MKVGDNGELGLEGDECTGEESDLLMCGVEHTHTHTYI